VRRKKRKLWQPLTAVYYCSLSHTTVAIIMPPATFGLGIGALVRNNLFPSTRQKRA